jgi:hypothetical protein
MSLIFFDNVFLLLTVITDVMPLVAKVVQHTLYRAGAAPKTLSDSSNGEQPLFPD